MNNIASFRLCTLSNQELIEAVDKATDELYNSEKQALRRITRHIPARPNEDYDLIVGELIYRFAEMNKQQEKLIKALTYYADHTALDEETGAHITHVGSWTDYGTEYDIDYDGGSVAKEALCEVLGHKEAYDGSCDNYEPIDEFTKRKVCVRCGKFLDSEAQQ